MPTLEKSLDQALEARAKLQDLGDFENLRGLRLFNGFYEGYPSLVADLYGTTLVLFNYGESRDVLAAAGDFYRKQLPWLTCVIHKTRSAPDPAQLRGIIAFGDSPTEKIREHGVWYALDLMMQQDASFYLDTRNLRKWLLENAKGSVLSGAEGEVEGWRVLNTFAYTNRE